MATQIVRVDAHAIPETMALRLDVEGVLVVVMAAGEPFSLRRVPRPRSGELTRADLRRLIAAAGNVPPDRRASPARMRRLRGGLTVVVPTHERPTDLARCLEGLADARDAGHEVIVVDNAPVTTLTADVAQRFGVRRVVAPVRGLNRARNAGMSAARNAIVAFVDDDVVVGAGWADAVLDAFDDTAIDCCTGLVLPLELETAGQEEYERYSAHRRDFRPRVHTRLNTPPSTAVVVGVGANMAFRRDLVLTLGGFDERLGPPGLTRAADETDMFARVLDAGGDIAYAPSAYVWHRHRRAMRDVRSCVFGYGVGIHALLTKRLVEQRDFRALETAARWIVGPLVKAVRARLLGNQAPSWSVVLAEAAGAPLGPLCFAVESWLARHPREQSGLEHAQSAGAAGRSGTIAQNLERE